MRTRYPLLVLLAGAISTLLASCTDDHPIPPPTVVIPDDTVAIVYSKHIAPIFANSCSSSGCHFNRERAGGLNLETWESTMEGSETRGSEVIPFSPERSHLFRHINTDTALAPIAYPHMPLSRDPLPRSQVLTIQRWIREGARNDAGTISLDDAGRPRVFVTNQSEDVTSVIDLASERVARYISNGVRTSGAPEAPHNAVLSPDGSYLYINLISSGVIEKYDARTFQRLGSAVVGASPAQIAVTSDGSRLFVSNFDLTLVQKFIVVVNAGSMTVTDTIADVGNAPHGTALSPDGSLLITTNALGDDLSIIDATTLEVLHRIPASPGNPLPPGIKAKLEPYQGEFTGDGRFFWFTCRAGAQVRILDVTSLQVVDSISVAARPLIAAFTPDRREFWTPGQASSQVSIVDAPSRRVVATIGGLDKQPHAVAFTADGRTAFVSCENQTGDAHHPTTGTDVVAGKVYVIDVASRTVRRVIEVGGFAAGIAVGR